MPTEEAAGASVIRSYKTSLVPAFGQYGLSRPMSPGHASDDPSDRAGIAWLQRHGVAVSSKASAAEIHEAVATVADLDARLWRHHVLTNEAKAACVDWFLTMSAARSVSGAPVDRKEACLLVTEWLSVEDAAQARASDLPVVDDPVTVFATHLKECGLDDDLIRQWVDQATLALKANRRSDAVVVDRRQCYSDLCASASSGTASDAEDGSPTPMCYLDTIGRIEDNRDINASARSLVSERFGTGRGSDHDALISIARDLRSKLRSDEPVAREVLVSAQEQLADIRTAGRPSSWRKLLDEIVTTGRAPDPLQQARLTKMLDAVLKNVRPDGLQKGQKWWTDCLVNAISDRLVAANHEHDLGLDDDTTSSLFLGPWETNGRSEVMLGAMTVISTRRTKTSTQIDDLIAEHDKAEAAELLMGSDPLWSGLRSYEEMRAPTSGGLYRLSDRSCRGFGNLIGTWKGLTTAAEVVAVTEELISDGRVGEAVFFRWLAAEVTDHGAASQESLGKKRWEQRCDGAQKALEVFLDKRRAEDKTRRMRMPVLTMPDPLLHPLSALHGNNCWYMDLLDDGRVALGLAGGERVQVRLKSDRYEREIVSPSRRDGGGITAVVRDSHLGRQAAGVAQDEQEVYVRVANASLTVSCLYPHRASSSAVSSQRERRWICTAPLRLVPRGPLHAWQQATPGARLSSPRPPSTADYGNWPFASITTHWRVLGVDLGIRVAASWSVVETTQSGDGIPVKNRDDLATRCITQGAIEHLGERFVPIRKEKRIINELARFMGESPYPSWDPEPDQYGLMRRSIALLRGGLRHESRLMALVRLGRSIGQELVDDDSLYRAWTSRTRATERTGDNGPDWQDDIAKAITWEGGEALTGELLADLATEAWTSYDRRLGELWDQVEVMVLGTKGHRGISGRGYGLAGDALATLDVIDKWYQLCCARHGRPQPGSPSGRRLPDNFMGSLRVHRANLRSHVANQVAARLVQTALDHGCHGMVLEDLSKYSTSAYRTKAENAKLRIWAKARVADAVRQACETYGLGYRAVNPHGTSHLNFASNLEKGVRVEVVDSSELSDPEKPWQRGFTKAKRNVDRHEKAGTTASDYDKALVALTDWIAAHDEHNVLPEKVVIPRRGGHYLVSPVDDPVRWHECLAKGALVDADLNASAVIGWRGLGALPPRGRGGAATGEDA